MCVYVFRAKCKHYSRLIHVPVPLLAKTPNHQSSYTTLHTMYYAVFTYTHVVKEGEGIYSKGAYIVHVSVGDYSIHKYAMYMSKYLCTNTCICM